MATTLRVAMTLEQCWHRVPGGTAVAALGSASALARRDDVDVVGVSAFHRRRPPDEWAPAVRVRRLPLPRIALYESWHRLRRPRVQLATGERDVIHATTIAIPPKTAPLVVTMNDVAFIRYPSYFTAKGMSFFMRGLALALRDADAVVCPSRATMEDCRAAGFDDQRLHYVPWGIDAQRATEADVERVRRHYGLGRRYVLWAGTIEPRKNLRGLVEAFEALDGSLDLVLAGPEGWHEDVQPLVERARRPVRALGFVPKRDLSALYAGADVFCFPSLLEGFGFPVLEAMAQGTPVVTSAGTSTEELGADAAILVDPRDAGSIASALQEVVEDEALASKLADAGRARASEFSWDRTAELVRRTYAAVAA